MPKPYGKPYDKSHKIGCTKITRRVLPKKKRFFKGCKGRNREQERPICNQINGSTV